MATSRERLNQTLNHIEPEEVVVDMGATPITGINANALDRLRRALGLEEKRVRSTNLFSYWGKWKRMFVRNCKSPCGSIHRHEYVRIFQVGRSLGIAVRSCS